MGMCRYANKDDDGYVKVVGELQLITSTIQQKMETEEHSRQQEIAMSRVDSPSHATTVSSIYST